MAYEIGTAFIQIVPSFRNLERNLRKGARDMADEIDKEFGKALPESFERGVEEANRRARRASRQGGKESAGEFAGHFIDTLSRRLDAVLRALPTLTITADSSAAERRLAVLRREVTGFRELLAEGNLDDRTVLHRARILRGRVNTLMADSAETGIRLPVDLSQARDELDAWLRVAEAGGERAAREVERQLTEAARNAARAAERAAADAARAARQQAEEAAKAAERAFSKTWAGRVRQNVDNALAALPDIGTRPARDADEQRVKDLRGRLTTLREQRIGVDIDDREARRVIAGLKADLIALARSKTSVEVQADAVAAASELAGIERMADRLDRRQVHLRVHADGKGLDDLNRAAQVSLSRLESLIGLSLSLGTALVPAAAAASSLVGFLGTSFAAAGAGLGVMVLGFSGVGEAVKALQKDAEEAEKKTSSLARSNLQVAGAAEAIESAERSLANVRANNAEAARRATLAVQDAERQVARAQEDARRATEDLVRAREDERRANQDLAFDLEELHIAQRQAAIDQIDAKKELDKILANPRATEEQREQARITYDQITLRIRELGVEHGRLAEQQEKANEVGVEGSDRVQAAHERVRDAAEAVEAAERRRSEALRAQQSQQRQAAFAVAQAQASLASAYRQAEQASVRAGVAGGDAADNLREAMDDLSPSAQRFARFLFGLRDEVLSLRAAASDPMLPGVQRAIEGLLPFLPQFRDWIGRVAGSVGDLFERTSELLTTDRTWRRFWGHMDAETVPTMERLWRIGRNVTTGLLGLYLAFTPFNDDIGSGLEEFTEKFARWSRDLDQNPGFQEFLEYIRNNGPRVVDLVGELATFVGRFVQAAAPVGSLVLEAFTSVLEAINAIPMPILYLLVGGMAAWNAVLLISNSRSRLLQLNEQVRSRVMMTVTGVTNASSVATTAYAGALATATIRSGQLSGALVGMQTSMGLARRAGQGLIGMLGGPWSAALIAATLAASYISVKLGEQRRKVDELKQALGLLGEAYRETRNLSSESVQGVIAQNRALTDLVNKAGDYGVSVEAIARATAGEKAAQDEVIEALTRKRDSYILIDRDAEARLKLPGGSEEREAAQIVQTIKALEEKFAELEANRRAQLALDEAQRKAVAGSSALTAAQLEISDAMAANAERIKVLTGFVGAFSNAESTAAQRADALRKVIEGKTAAAQSAIEQDELWRQKLLDLSLSVQSNGRALVINTKGTLEHQQAALRNRDALEAAATAARDMYLADIEAGKPMADITAAHKRRIEALKQEADRLDLNTAETNKLIAAYGEIPKDVKTALETKNFKKVYEELEQLQFMQFSLARGLTPKQAEDQWNAHKNPPSQKARHDDGYGVPVAFPGFRDGGLFRGRGTSTSDSNLAWLSNREFVQPAASVDYYGQGLMEALRTRSVPREVLPGYAAGGLVVPMRVSLAGVYVPTLDEALAKVIPQATPGGIGSADMMKILRSRFPGLELYSGFRPGSRTASGNLSYHAMFARDGDPGRAVDLPPRRDVFNWIHDAYFSGTRELIWAGDANRNIHNGRHHRYSPSILANHGVAGTPNAHLHWAYDSGGMLPPGVSTVYNGTGRPEPVLTEPQWQQVATLVRDRDAGPREVHNWHFKEAALDHGRLAAWADRRDAMARPGRRR